MLKKTGVIAKQEDFDRLKVLAGRGWRQGEPMIVFSVGEGIAKDEGTQTALKACHRLALAYGLPEIQGYYGIDNDGEFVTT